MRQHLAMLVVGLLGGCSWIYNPDNLKDGKLADTPTIDAMADASILRDADPSMLVITNVFPKTIYEGQGIGGSAPVTLLLAGHNIVDGFTVDIEPATNITMGTPVRSMSGDYISVPVTIAINASSAAVPLTVTVMEPSGGSMSMSVLAGMLTLQNLPPLDVVGNSALVLATIATATYSDINISGNVTFTGPSQRAVLTSMSSITIGGTITATGGAASAGSGNQGAAGPGGCAGGDVGVVGGCSGVDGGGGPASGTDGGGGGGFSAPGVAGTGGASGLMHGNGVIASYDGTDQHDVNQSSGGGGGGNGALSNAGAGGGGGGTVELAAGGNISTGSIDVSGGAGGNATGIATSAGGGGGGSGGVIVLRTDAGTITSGTLMALEGSGGTKQGSGGAGGAGSRGRIRCDAQGPIPTTNMPLPHRGPSFAAGTPTVVTTFDPMITMVGTDGDIVDLYVIDGAGVDHFGEPTALTFSNGMLTFTASLLDGYNKLCATVRPGVRGTHEADKCIEIDYLP